MLFHRKKSGRNEPSLIAKSIRGSDTASSSGSSVNESERRRPAKAGSPVFSYYARSANQNSQNTGRRDENDASRHRSGYRLKLGHIPSYIALGAILIAVVYSCYLQPNPKIVITNSPGTIHRDAAAYQEVIESIWKDSLLNQTKLTVPTAKIRQNIQDQFSELANVQIELPLLGRRPTVILAFEKPELQLISNNGAFYVNSSGKVMARTTDVAQNELEDLPLVRDETGILAETGKNVLSGPEATFLKKLFLQLQAEGVAVQSITLPALAAREADVRVVGQQYYVKFSFDTDPRQAVGTYLAARAKLESEGVTPGEYMDVRVEEKVFYR